MIGNIKELSTIKEIKSRLSYSRDFFIFKNIPQNFAISKIMFFFAVFKLIAVRSRTNGGIFCAHTY